MNLLRLAWKSMLNRRGTALLTLATIAVSVALLLGVEKGDRIAGSRMGEPPRRPSSRKTTRRELIGPTVEVVVGTKDYVAVRGRSTLLRANPKSEYRNPKQIQNTNIQ